MFSTDNILQVENLTDVFIAIHVLKEELVRERTG